MARLPRLTVPDLPHSVVQRGNNQQVIFAGDADCEMLVSLLVENARIFQVAVHSYLLMPSHFHLLATPAAAASLPQFMQAVGRSYVRYFNQRQGRTGTLWEGRYRSTLVEPERYLLACMTFMDLVPVKSGLAAVPRDYRWSSHQHYVGLRADPAVTPHALYWELGNTPFAREIAYADLVASGLPAQQELAIAESTHSGWPLASPEFVAKMQPRTSRRLAKASPGRPRAKPLA